VILAAGLSPAWQQIMCFRQFRIGEVNRAAAVHWCASGKVINVGMAMAAVQWPSHTLSPAGGWSGAAMRAEFAKRGLDATWIPTATPTRICTTLLDQAAATSTELVENAAALAASELDDFLAKYREIVKRAQAAVLTGSLPAGTPATFFHDLLEGAACPVVLDARGPELLAALPCRPRVVKPNREELALTVGRPLPDRASVLSAMRELIERGAQAVIVTQGKEAVWVMEGSRTWEVTPPAVTPVVNPIGCGDCLAAGVAIGLARGDALVDAVRFGMAAAAVNVTQLLPAALSPERVQAILAHIAASPIAG
jgi:1-phosphofructokinase family hexose kinase